MNTMYKYIPKKIEDLLIDKNIKNLLYKLISINDIRIVLHGNDYYDKQTIMNCILNDYYQENKRNIFFINTIKEQGINNFRNEIKTFCETTTIEKIRKVIVVENLDLLSLQTQQIIRNTMDTYSNVHFISSCFNINKVIENIISKCIPIYINKIKKDDIYNYICKICNLENIKLDNDSIKTLITLCNFDMEQLHRDIEKILIIKDDNITITNDYIKKLCSTINYTLFDNFTNSWYKEKSIEKCISLINHIYDYGYSVIDILEYYFEYIKCCSLIPENIKFITIQLITKYIHIFHTIHEDEIELQILCYELCNLI